MSSHSVPPPNLPAEKTSTPETLSRVESTEPSYAPSPCVRVWPSALHISQIGATRP